MRESYDWKWLRPEGRLIPHNEEMHEELQNTASLFWTGTLVALFSVVAMVVQISRAGSLSDCSLSQSLSIGGWVVGLSVVLTIGLLGWSLVRMSRYTQKWAVKDEGTN